MPPIQDDPTYPVLSWAYLMALAWIIGACFLRTWRTTRTAPPENPPMPQGGLSTEIYRAWDLVVVFLLFFLFAGLVLILPGDKTSAPVAITPEMIATNVFFLFLLAGLVITVVAYRLDAREWLGLKWPRWRSIFWIAPLSVVVMWGIFGGLVWAGYMDWMKTLGVDPVQESVRTLQESANPAILGWMTFAALVAAPLCEEVIFRGYCYPVLKKYGGAIPSLVTTSLIFACAHGNLPSALPLFLLGMLLVYIYERTGSLWAPIAVHFLFNAATVTMQFLARWYDIPFEHK